MSGSVFPTISTAEFLRLTRPLIGLPLSRTWRGAGTAIFFDLGQLRPTEGGRLRGEASVMLEWSWRVERRQSVSFGSFSSPRKFTNGLARLQGLTLQELCVTGRLPELVLELSCGYWVHSFTTVEGQPEWTLFLPDATWLRVSRGRMIREWATQG